MLLGLVPKVVLITPPMTQINTPYPATAYLTGFLRERGHDVAQRDASIALILRLFCRDGLTRVHQQFEQKFRDPKSAPKTVRHFLFHHDRYLRTIDSVLRFLQGNDLTFANRLTNEGFLPEGGRFETIREWRARGEDLMGWAFGHLGVVDRAKHLASLYIDDIADAIRDGIDPHFELSRYAEKLAVSAASFDPILQSLQGAPTLVDSMLDELTREWLEELDPKFVGLSIPFPGNVYGAFRIAQTVKKLRPEVKVIVGGGYVNTELRELKDPRVFDFVDFITLDDGERPFLSLLEGKGLLRTLVRQNGKVTLHSDPSLHDIPLKDAGTPTYDGLPLKSYLSLCEMLNPMHRLWSDGRWNKLTLAHGCYWKKCSFCDTSLDYISRFDDLGADLIVDRIEKLVAETGQTGFHFVDEAAPPKVLLAMANRLIARQVNITWWGNIRFEKTFTPELVKRLAESGCVAVSGGLEVASDRLLALMEKGVTVEQVARVTHAFTEAGIMVHAYLMFGFPTQTVAETVDSLERVRQLFAAGCLQSAFWHRFACTVHSPVGKNPERYGIKLLPVESTFARNDVSFEDSTGVDHDRLHPGLKKALYNFMHGVGLDEDVRAWFDFPVPKAKVPKNLITGALRVSGGKHVSV